MKKVEAGNGGRTCLEELREGDEEATLTRRGKEKRKKKEKG